MSAEKPQITGCCGRSRRRLIYFQISVHEAARFVVADAGQHQHFGAHSSFLELGDARFCWTDGYDLILTGMDCKYGKSPAFGGRCWSSRHRNSSAKAVRILTAKVPGTGAAHAETSDDDLFPIDVVAAEDSVEECVHCSLVLGSRPRTSGGIRRDNDRAQFLQRRTHQDIEHAAARAVRLPSKMQCED